MTKYITAREAAEMLGLPHREIIRRIRRKDIKAVKWGGWSWAVELESVEAAKTSDWYLRSSYPKSQVS